MEGDQRANLYDEHLETEREETLNLKFVSEYARIHRRVQPIPSFLRTEFHLVNSGNSPSRSWNASKI